MRKTQLILLIVLAIAALALIRMEKNKADPITPAPEPVEEVKQTESIEGCYVALTGKDVYTINVQSDQGGNISGTLSYKNYQKDSSSGTLNGTYDGQRLVGIYDFHSEGIDSIRQVVFKKTASGFIQGFGDVNVVGNEESLLDIDNLDYSNSPEYVATPCLQQ